MKTTIISTALIVSLQTGIAFGDDSPAEVFGQAALADSERRIAELPTRARNTPTVAHRRMAERAKVSPSDYSHHEILQIMAARSSAYESEIGVKMDQIHGVTPRAADHISEGEGMLAAGAGVKANTYTLSDLARMKFDQDK